MVVGFMWIGRAALFGLGFAAGTQVPEQCGCEDGERSE
jgi:hypothetical protein